MAHYATDPGGDGGVEAAGRRQPDGVEEALRGLDGVALSDDVAARGS